MIIAVYLKYPKQTKNDSCFAAELGKYTEKLRINKKEEVSDVGEKRKQIA